MAERSLPMVRLSCRVPAALNERIKQAMQATGQERCDVIRRALDLGLLAIESARGDGTSQNRDES